MDRRQQKTRKAVFDALGRLLQDKAFYDITVQDILDEANIGRSTYYDHFQSRDDLLKAMCDDLFAHISAAAKDHGDDLRGLFVHILGHLGDEKESTLAVLLSPSRSLLLNHLKEEISPVLAGMGREGLEAEVVTYAFIGTVDWWIDHRDSCTPEQAVDRLSSIVPL